MAVPRSSRVDASRPRVPHDGDEAVLAYRLLFLAMVVTALLGAVLL